MSAPSLMCDRCSFEVDLCSIFPYYCLYELPDGGHVPIPRRTEWCYQCKTLCDAENLPDYASVKKKLREAKGGVLFQLFSKLFPCRNERLETAERLHYVFSDRKSLPRCLSCGSFDHKELPLTGYPEGKRTVLKIQHPNCGGNFIIDDRLQNLWGDAVCSKRYYTPEGIFLRSDSPFKGWKDRLG